MNLPLMALSTLANDSNIIKKKEKKIDYFLPGQNFKILPRWRRTIEPQYSLVKVKTPGRLHFSVFDFSLMTPGLGGGGLGISTSTGGNEIEIYFDKNKQDNPDNLIPTWNHLLNLFKELVNYQGNDLHIKISRIIRHFHSGLGSNVTFNTAVISGLNALFGSPFSQNEIWDIVTMNFVENTDDNKSIYFGLDTGVGEAALLYGGIVWIESNPKNHEGYYLGNLQSNNLWVVTGIGIEEKLATEKMLEYKRMGANKISDNTELDILSYICKAHQTEYGYKLYQFLKNKLKPAFLRNDFYEFFDLCWELNVIGTMKAMGIAYNYEIMKALSDKFHDMNALYAGLSSAGPGAFVFTKSEDDAKRMQEIWFNSYNDYFKDINIGKAGEKLIIDLS